MKRIFTAFLPLLLILSQPVCAVGIQDSLPPLPTLDINTSESENLPPIDRATQFRPQQLIAPGALILAGSLTISHKDINSINGKIKAQMQQWSDGNRLRFDDYIQYAPVVSHLLLGLGANATHTTLERTFVIAMAYLSMGIMVNSVKYTVKSLRPDGSRYNSFPSGHTATTFMGAELVRLEYGPWYGLVAYSVACTVAFMRMYNNRHWFSDVLAGAGVGILSAQIGYWLLPPLLRLFNLDNKKDKDLSLSIAPFYLADQKAGGCSLSMSF